MQAARSLPLMLAVLLAASGPASAQVAGGDSAWAPEAVWEPIPSAEAIGAYQPREIWTTAQNGGITLVAGRFYTPEGLRVPTVAFLADGVWQPWGGEVPLVTIRSVIAHRGTVWAGGTRASGGESGLVRFTLGQWEPVVDAGLGLAEVRIRDLAVHQGRLAVLARRLFFDPELGSVDSTWIAFIAPDSTDSLALPEMPRFPSVTCLESVGDSLLFLGGRFEATSVDSAQGLLEWDGTDWRGAGRFDGTVSDLIVYEGEVVAAGWFATVNGEVRHRIARRKFDRFREKYRWDRMGGLYGSFPYVNRLAVQNAMLVVIGNFESADGMPAWDIARFDGRGWSAVGSWNDPDPDSDRGRRVFPADVFFHRGVLHAAGRISYEDNSVAHLIAFDEDERVWRPVPDWGFRPFDRVTALHETDQGLLVAARFHRPGSLEVEYGIGRFRRDTWTELANTDGPARAFVQHGDRLYVGGEFEHLGEIETPYLGWWDGSRWWPMGGGPNGPLYALASYQGDLYAGGDFDRIGDLPASNIARFQGLHWDAVQGGVTGGFSSVRGFEAYDGELVVSGRFTFAGARFAGGLAGWNGTRWRPLTEGLEFYVSAPLVEVVSVEGALVMTSERLKSIHGRPAENLAVWDGTLWRPYWDPAQTARVYSISSHRGRLLVYGRFDYESQFRGVHTWDGSRLQQVGDGLRVSGSATMLGTRDELIVGSSYDGVLVGDAYVRPLAVWRAPRDVTGAAPVTLRAVPNPIRSPGPLRLQWSHEGIHPVTLDILDIQGRQVTRILETTTPGGPNEAFWRLRDGRGVPVPAGVYFARLRIGATQQVTRIVVTR